MYPAHCSAMHTCRRACMYVLSRRTYRVCSCVGTQDRLPHSVFGLAQRNTHMKLVFSCWGSWTALSCCFLRLAGLFRSARRSRCRTYCPHERWTLDTEEVRCALWPGPRVPAGRSRLTVPFVVVSHDCAVVSHNRPHLRRSSYRLLVVSRRDQLPSCSFQQGELFAGALCFRRRSVRKDNVEDLGSNTSLGHSRRRVGAEPERVVLADRHHAQVSSNCFLILARWRCSSWKRR